MARYLNFKHADGIYNFSKTVAELLKLSHFKNFKGFGFDGLNESFDIGTIFEYLKKNKTTGAFFLFTGQISKEYKEKLEAIVDEVLGAESPRSYIPPYIKYDGQEDNKKDALLNLCKPYL
uniref:Uncharacterized protein n=1 Tax=Panagrolaimus davidi TaxID=227884 RepID=A0A914PKL2_9BILA